MSDRPLDESRSETVRHGARLDLRLVPPALTGWAVTAAGILWPVGAALTAVFVVAVGAVLAARHRMPGCAGVLAVCVVGAGFAFGDHPAFRQRPRAPRCATVRLGRGGDRDPHGESTFGGQRPNDVPGRT